MAEKDVTEKILESYNDVFSDIVNVLLFGGKEVVAPDELEDQAPRAYYKADDRVRGIPPRFEPFVNDYKINLFEVAYLTHEQVELFQSDFRIIADYFVQKREKGADGEYTPDPREIRHVQETLQLLSVMTKDRRFEEAYNEAHMSNPTEGGPHTMCEFLDKVENRGVERGIEKGIETGIERGELKAKREMAFSLAGMGIPLEKIAEAAKVSVEVVKQWLAPTESAAK